MKIAVIAWGSLVWDPTQSTVTDSCHSCDRAPLKIIELRRSLKLGKHRKLLMFK